MATKPHDHLFRYVFGLPEYAAAVMEAFLPEHLARRLDLSRLTLLDPSLIDAELKKTIGDFVYAVPMTAEGSSVVVWLLHEHQSTSPRRMALRLLRYMVRLWTFAKVGEHLPLIVPVVLSNALRPWRAPRRFSELYGLSEETWAPFARSAVDFEYVVADLAAASEEAIAARVPLPFLRLVLWSLRARGSPATERDAAWIAMFRALRPLEKQDPLRALVRYHLSMTKGAASRIIEAAAEADREVEMTAMSLYDRLVERGREEGREQGLRAGREEGREQGLEAGREEGREQGREQGLVAGREEAREEARRGVAATLRQLLTLRFGPLDAAALERIDAAPLSTLERWTLRVLTAERLDDVFS
ncbi:MAG: Rpn family recombination-promoting nuclease/putative transposase [Deltaproteobacteria bacterium]